MSHGRSGGLIPVRDGDKEFLDTIEEATRIAETYERILPHVSDTINKLIRYIEALDKNQKGLIRTLLNGMKYERQIESMLVFAGKFLNSYEVDKIIQHGEDIKAGKIRGSAIK